MVVNRRPVDVKQYHIVAPILERLIVRLVMFVQLLIRILHNVSGNRNQFRQYLLNALALQPITTLRKVVLGGYQYRILGIPFIHILRRND